MRKDLLEMSKAEAIKDFRLSPEMPILTIIGGSQGSKAINQVVSASVDDLCHRLSIQVIWQTGPLHYDTLSPIESRFSGLRIFPFLERVGPAYSAADLIVSRAGALTLAETAHCGKPSLLIPFRGASADHQTRNAKIFEDAGAAEVILESHLSPERFVKEVETLITDPRKLSKMGTTARSLSTPDAAKEIVNQIVALAEA
ncbi:MAG: glycosyltransferase [Candidatus Neomarinimicrobiota bacterium]